MIYRVINLLLFLRLLNLLKKKLKKEEERFWVKKRVLPAYGVRKPMKEDNLIPI